MSPVYQFRPLTEADMPMIRRWLAAPHVVEWWGDPDEQFELVHGDLHHAAMDQFVVAMDDRPFGYLQCYDPAAWPVEAFGTLPIGTRGIDQFIGEADLIGCGHGSAFIRTYADRLLAAGAPLVLTDPNPDNRRAIRAYEKAGFTGERVIETPHGPALFMVRNQ
jgi:aminoglycoside 6'-N-acetyltransferase